MMLLKTGAIMWCTTNMLTRHCPSSVRVALCIMLPVRYSIRGASDRAFWK